jgi:hypothetical protein
VHAPIYQATNQSVGLMNQINQICKAQPHKAFTYQLHFPNSNAFPISNIHGHKSFPWRGHIRDRIHSDPPSVPWLISFPAPHANSLFPPNPSLVSLKPTALPQWHFQIRIFLRPVGKRSEELGEGDGERKRTRVVAQGKLKPLNPDIFLTWYLLMYIMVTRCRYG